MQTLLAEAIGIAAAVASLYAANSKTIIPLRVAAIAANCLAAVYGLSHASYPTVILNLILLPLNVWRLVGMIRLINSIDAALKSDMNAEWLLPYTRPMHFKAGEVIMKQGDHATAAFYIVAGEAEIRGLDQVFGKGSLLGEIGLFTPNRVRTKTVRCRTDVQAAVIDYDRFKELYFQNPQFGFRLLHLVVARLQAGDQSSSVSL